VGDTVQEYVIGGSCTTHVKYETHTGRYALGDTCVNEKKELAVEETGGITCNRQTSCFVVSATKHNDEQLCCITSCV
jgi:hypothetical protein